MVSIKLPNVGVGDGIILNPSRDWEFGSGRGLVVGGMGGSMVGAEFEGTTGAGGTGAGREDAAGVRCEEGWSMFSRSCCCSNIFSRAVLHLMRVGRGTLQSNTHTVYIHICRITMIPIS